MRGVPQGTGGESAAPGRNSISFMINVPDERVIGHFLHSVEHVLEMSFTTKFKAASGLGAAPMGRFLETSGILLEAGGLNSRIGGGRYVSGNDSPVPPVSIDACTSTPVLDAANTEG